MMWQEARKQERKIRGMLVDYKRRAERRRDYYEKIKADPTQFIQVHGRPCKIHLDPAVAIAGDSPANMMSWQGNQDILIDRFDVRAHLDYIPETKAPNEQEEEISQEDRQINYERYRILAQNDFLGVTEDKFLNQLSVEEQFGPVEKVEPQAIEGKKKVVGATIGYNYNEGAPTPSAGTAAEEGAASSGDENDDDDDDDDEDSDIDFDLCVDVNKISSTQAHEMNASALSYGMVSNDFFSFLTRDVEEAETLKMAKEREEEKAMFSGRKSRRERRAYREKKLVGRKLSPPSYAASKEQPIADLIRNVTKAQSRSHSRSPSPPNAGMIQYITSFGGEEPPLEPPPPQSIKASVHTSKKEEDIVYKRTVRYRSSRTPELSPRRHKSRSVERSVRYRSWSRERTSDNGRRSRSRSPRWQSKTLSTRRVRYRSRSRSNSPHHSPTKVKPRDSKEYESSHTSLRKKQSYSKSRSPSPTIRVVKKSSSPQPVRSVEIPAPPVITRYYGRRKNQSSSSELDLSDSEEKSDKTSDKLSAPDKSTQAVGNSGGRSKQPATTASKMSLQERLKKKRQAMINRQYKADKRAERLRQEKAEQERQDREDEMREISIKMRRRERQKRHKYYERDDSNAAENSDEGSRSPQSSDSRSSKAGSDVNHRSKSNSPRRSKDPEKSRSSRERDKSKTKESRRDSDSRKESDMRRDRERSADRERKARRNREEDRCRGRDDERYRTRDRSRDRPRGRSRSTDRDRYRRDRDRSRDRVRERSRERDRNWHRNNLEQESGPSVKKPMKPLVDY